MLQSTPNPAQIGTKENCLDLVALWSNAEKRIKNKGLSIAKGAQTIGVSRTTLLRLRKAAQGLNVSIGKQSLFKIKRFVENGKRGQRKPAEIKHCWNCGVPHPHKKKPTSTPLSMTDSVL